MSARFAHGGGPLLSRAEVQAVFWGSGWLDQEGAKRAARLSQLLDTLVSVVFMLPLAQYGVQPGLSSPPVTLADAPLPAAPDPLEDAALSAHLAGLARDPASRLAALHPQRLYVVFPPPGQAVANALGVSGQAFSGYHDAETRAAPDVYYAVIPVPVGTLRAVLAAVVPALSHELAEAVTDPLPGTGWTDEQGLEIADANQTRLLGGVRVARIFSNQGGGLV